MTINHLPGVMSSSLHQVFSRSRNGKIHSLFNHSFNIGFEEDLVNINRMGNQLSSFGINLDAGELDVLLPNLEIGDLVKSDGARLLIYSTYGAVISIETNKLKVIDLALKPIKATPNRLILIHNILEQIELSQRVGLPLNTSDLKQLVALVGGKPDSTAFKMAVRYLVGRGKGLTPSGDDLLLGFFLVQQLFSQSSSLTDSLISYIEQNTTAISTAYLKSLKNGYISEFFQAFCQAAAHEDKTGLEQAVEKIKTFGSTSGYDSLLGLSLGISKIEGEIGYPLRLASNPNAFLSNIYQFTEA